MRILDAPNPKRIDRLPDASITIFSNGQFKEDGYTIKQIDLRLYVEKIDPSLGPYSIITSLVYTDNDSIEMIYDEGFRGQNALESTANFLTNALGMSSLVLRSVISLRHEQERQKSKNS